MDEMAGAVANTMANTRQTVRTAGELAELAGAISALIGRAGREGVAAGRNGPGGPMRTRAHQTLSHADDTEAAGGV
jgi:hypothetical protein